MQSEEQRIIDGLFQRLKQAELRSGPRDDGADRQIQEYIHQQPAAPYYMAQSMLIQEAALKRLHQQVQQLENALEQVKNAPPAKSGGFLSQLFGGGARTEQPSNPTALSNQQQPAPGYGGPSTPPPGYNGYAQGYAPPQAAPRSGGFMAGALQTAAGVAGGVVLGNMLTGMFHHNQPEDIVNVIQQPMDPLTDPLTNQDFSSDNLDTFNDVSGDRFLSGDSDSLANNDYDSSTGNDYDADNGFGADDPFSTGDDYSDDDNFI